MPFTALHHPAAATGVVDARHQPRPYHAIPKTSLSLAEPGPTALLPCRAARLHADAVTAAPMPTITSDDMVDVNLLAVPYAFEYILMNAKKKFIFLFSL